MIDIRSTRQLPAVISAIIGLTEGTIDVASLKQHLGDEADRTLISQLGNIDIGAQAKLRHALPHPVPKAGDVFLEKTDIWPSQAVEITAEDGVPADGDNNIEYL